MILGEVYIQLLHTTHTRRAGAR